MTDSTEVLAAFVQTHLITIEADPRIASDLCQEIDAETFKTIRESSRISWLPLSLHAELTHALFEIATPGAARAICRAAVRSSFEQPFLKPLVTGALRVLGDDLVRVARWAPKGYGVVLRNAGTMEWIPTDACSGRLVVTGAPECLTGDPLYLEGIGGGFEALFDLTDTTGELSIRGGGSEIVMDMRWKPRRSGAES